VPGRGESYWAPPLPAFLHRFFDVEGEGDYHDLVLLTGSTVIGYFG
jgi:hypothetical protein